MSEKMTLEEVNRFGREEFVSRLGSLFESSPWVAERAWLLLRALSNTRTTAV